MLRIIRTLTTNAKINFNLCSSCETQLICISNNLCKNKLDDSDDVGTIGIGIDAHGNAGFGIRSPIPNLNIINFNNDIIKYDVSIDDPEDNLNDLFDDDYSCY